MTRRFERSVEIVAAPSAVWAALTEPSAMAQWIGAPEMGLEVITDWSVGGSIVLRGSLHGPFEARGTVLRCEPPRRLAYTHLSSVSRLPDRPDSYSTLAFELTPADAGTTLTLAIEGFPTEAIFKHLQFYWRGTLGVLRTFVERGA